jgi:hypothetical protein
MTGPQTSKNTSLKGAWIDWTTEETGAGALWQVNMHHKWIHLSQSLNITNYWT